MLKAVVMTALLSLAACKQGPTFDRSAATTSAQTNAAMNEIGPNDGREQASAPLTAGDAGDRMRSTATEAPRR